MSLLPQQLKSVKAIIFDWGGVFVDAETKERYPEGKEVLAYCKAKGYRLGLVVIASKFEERKKQIEESDLREFFEIFLIGPLTPEQIWDPTFKGKDDLYDQIIQYFHLPPHEVLIIDDRVVRGIRYANTHGHPCIWIHKGKFAHELPNEATGEPTITVQSLKDVMDFL